MDKLCSLLHVYTRTEVDRNIICDVRVYPIAGLEHWTGLLDWTTGLSCAALYACAVRLMQHVVVQLCNDGRMHLSACWLDLEVLGSNKHVGLAREARVKMAKVNLRVYLTLPGLISLYTYGTPKEFAIIVGD